VVPDIVPEDKLNAANSWLQSTFHVAQLVGHAAGGILFRILGAPVLFLADGLSFFLSALSESFIRLPARPARARVCWRENLARFARETLEGIHYAFAHPGLRVYFVAAGAANFFQSGFIVLLPFYVSDVLHAPVDWYGYLVGGWGLGTFLGVVAGGAVRVEGRRRAAVLIVCILVLPLAQGCLALVRAETAALGLQMVAGVVTGFWIVSVTAILQREVESRVRGRVMGVGLAFRWGLIPLGMGFFGVLADLLGGNVPLIFAGCGLVLVAICSWAASRPAFRALLARRGGPA
jgi:predicted MFS family arabinose efflux permease